MTTHFVGSKILCANINLSSNSKLSECCFHPSKAVWVKEQLSVLDSKQEANGNTPEATFTWGLKHPGSSDLKKPWRFTGTIYRTPKELWAGLGPFPPVLHRWLPLRKLSPLQASCIVFKPGGCVALVVPHSTTRNGAIKRESKNTWGLSKHGWERIQLYIVS